MNSCWLCSSTCFVWLVIAPRWIHSLTFPGTKVWLMSLKFPGTSFKPFLYEDDISLLPVTFQRLWKMASQQCQLALLKALLDTHCQGPSICRDQAPIVVHIPSDSGSVFAATWIFGPKVWGPTVVIKTEVMKALISFSALVVTTSALWLPKTKLGQPCSEGCQLKLPVPCRALCSSLFCSWLWKPTRTSSTQQQNWTLPQLHWQLWIKIIRFRGKTCQTIMCRR